VLFVLIHGPQLAWTLSALGLLMAVSLLLCVVRIRMRSVAASALVHGCYNLSVFVTLFVATGGFRHLDKV
jgi:membrane protease YdiL (CAAX protease family)